MGSIVDVSDEAVVCEGLVDGSRVIDVVFDDGGGGGASGTNVRRWPRPRPREMRKNSVGASERLSFDTQQQLHHHRRAPLASCTCTSRSSCRLFATDRNPIHHPTRSIATTATYSSRQSGATRTEFFVAAGLTFADQLAHSASRARAKPRSGLGAALTAASSTPALLTLAGQPHRTPLSPSRRRLARRRYHPHHHQQPASPLAILHCTTLHHPATYGGDCPPIARPARPALAFQRASPSTPLPQPAAAYASAYRLLGTGPAPRPARDCLAFSSHSSP